MIGKIIGLAFLLVGQAQAEPSFRYSRDVLFEAQAQQALLAVALDPAVYAGSAVDFSDLRLFDDQQQETPYWLTKIAGSKTLVKRLPVSGTAPKLEKSAADGIVVTLSLDKDESAQVDGLTVVTAQHDFEFALTVQGSEDGLQWQPLLEQAMIYDYSRFMNFGKRDIALPKNQCRHFKIIVAKAVHTQVAALLEMTRSLQQGQELQRDEKIDLYNQALHIERIDLWRNESETVAEKQQRFDYPISDYQISRDAEQQLTQIDFDARLLPLNGLQLKFAPANFNRRAELQIPYRRGMENGMRTIAEGQLQAINFQDLQREQTVLNFSEQRRRDYRIVIRDRDNPPLQVDALIGVGPGYQILFLPQPGRHYRLVYAAENMETPRYDTAPIQELLRRGYQTQPAELGEELSADIPQQAFDWMTVLNSDEFLAGVLVVMVGVLGWSLYRVAQNMA